MMQDVHLGRFGDSRLELTGFFCIPVWFSLAARVYRSASLVVTERVRSVFGASFTISQ